MPSLRAPLPARNAYSIAVAGGRGVAIKKIAKKIGGSTTTVTRVAHWIENGMGGYEKILTLLFGARKQ